MAEFTLPETIDYRPLYGASKTRRLEGGMFEAVAAFWFDGRRQNIAHVIAETRRKAEKLARRKVGLQ